MVNGWPRWLLIAIGVLPFVLTAQVIGAQNDTQKAIDVAKDSLAENQSRNAAEIKQLRQDLASADTKIDALIQQIRQLGAEPVVQPRPVVTTTTTTTRQRAGSTTTTTTSPPPSQTTTTTTTQPPCTTLPVTGRCL